MKKIETEKLEDLNGGGCKKYLRRSNRAYKKGDNSAGLDHYVEYLYCMKLV